MKYKTIEEINAISLNDLDVMVDVVRRLVDISSVPVGVLFYEYSANETLEPYYRLILHESIDKPSLAEVETEFTIYKQELLDNFNSIMAAKNRLDALSDLRVLMMRTGNDEPNMKLFAKRIIEENDTALLDVLEAENAVYLPEKIAMEEIEEDIVIGRKAKGICNECLHVVRGHNSKANLSKAEIKAMKQTFKDILDDLKDGMPIEAKALIVAVNNPAFEGLKQKLLKVFTKHGL